MKTILGTIAALGAMAALAACSHDKEPAKTPQQATTSYPQSYQAQ